MTPQLKAAIENVISAFYVNSKKDYSSFAFNKKPRDHVYKDLTFLKDQLRVNRKNKNISLYCHGEAEVHSLLNAMNDTKEALNLDQNQIDWTNDLTDEVFIACLGKAPRTTSEKNVKIMLDAGHLSKIDCTEAKRLILARMRNMILTQNI